MSKIGIIGFGIVGNAVYEMFKDTHQIKVYDKYKSYSSLSEVCSESEFIFICLPTPVRDNKIDLSIIEDNVKEIVKYTRGSDKVIVIKSTVVPGTTASFEKQYPNTLWAFNPEFLRESTYLEDAVNPDRTVIGASNAQVALRLLDLYTRRFPGTKIFRTDPTTAEMVKYSANCLLATIVLHNNIMFDICQSLNLSWEEVASMVKEDRRLQSLKNYFQVTSQRGWGGKCFFKDCSALVGRAKELNVDISFIEKMISENLRIRKNYDWLEIPFAVTKED